MKKIVNGRRKCNNEVLEKSPRSENKVEGCSKGFVNGPCGSFFNGKCEVIKTKDCLWVLIYKRLKSRGKLEEFINRYVEPRSRFSSMRDKKFELQGKIKIK
ncbi:MAG: methylenetetrahydrofolate reductase C-terminal domain-containing protein [Endomicrobium sp.]|jgi:hypothetical protein|nr:methylenetetrahydrofolate reductase C-terminal domain-containing protein [Endomicrobium sp.]